MPTRAPDAHFTICSRRRTRSSGYVAVALTTAALEPHTKLTAHAGNTKDPSFFFFAFAACSEASLRKVSYAAKLMARFGPTPASVGARPR
jgi:hypothetical protein